MDKKEILGMVRGRLERNIAELAHSLETLGSSTNLDEDDTMDPEDFSQQSESRDKEMGMQLQLDAANAQLFRLDDYIDKDATVAETGALVETDKNWFYMGISLSPLQVDGKELYGVSPDSPAFNNIKGKSTGDTFKIGNNDHTILNIS